MGSKIPPFIDVYEDATAGICEDYATFKIKKSFDLRLAERIDRHALLYRDIRTNNTNQASLYVGNETKCIEKINNPVSFVRGFVKPNKRYLVTEDVANKVVGLLVAAENDFSLPLPPRDSRIAGFLNGYYTVTKGKFQKNTAFGGSYPGYQRYFVNTEFVKKGASSTKREEITAFVGSSDSYQALLRCGSILITGYPIQRCLLWCNDPGTADLLKWVLLSLLPKTGAVVTLNVTDSTTDFQSAAKSDCHSVMVHIRTPKDLSSTAWKKLKMLAEANKPALIIASFQPFMAYDADPEGLLKDSLYLVPAVITAAEFANNLRTKPAWLSVLASESMRYLHNFINAVETETAQGIDKLLARPNPNNIPLMTDEFLKTATVETESESDIIEQRDDFCVRLMQFVEEAGGDPKMVKHQGVGGYLKDLGVNRSEIKLPGHKNKVMCLVKRKWQPTDSITKGGENHAD